MFIKLTKPSIKDSLAWIDFDDVNTPDPYLANTFSVFFKFDDGKTWVFNHGQNPSTSNKGLNVPYPALEVPTAVVGGIKEIVPFSDTGIAPYQVFATSAVKNSLASDLVSLNAKGANGFASSYETGVYGGDKLYKWAPMYLKNSTPPFGGTDYFTSVTNTSKIQEQRFVVRIPNWALTKPDGSARLVTQVQITFDVYNSELGEVIAGWVPGNCTTVHNAAGGVSSVCGQPHLDTTRTVSFASINGVLLKGISNLVPSSTTMQSTNYYTIPYTLADVSKKKIPSFKWDFENANHIFNYWGQMGYYGFKDKTFANEWLPTNYVGISDIDNPGYIPANKLLDVFTKDNAPITKVVPWRDNLVVFTDTTTSMFIGRVPQSQQLINANVGVTDKYRDTVQVVSNSIVFKNKSDVFAFVPASGTDDAESLTVRNISRQISDLIAKVENEINFELSPNSKEYNVSSLTYNNDEYWLIYGNKALNKTTIFKYSWSRYCWIMDEYPIYLEDFIKTSEHQIVASDSNGIVYELLSDDAAAVLQGIAVASHTIAKAFNETLESPTISDELRADLKVLTENFLVKALGGLEYDDNDVLVPYVPKNNDLISGVQSTELIKSHFSKDYPIVKDWIDFIEGCFLTWPISYELQLGARRPLLDTHTMVDEVTVNIGNESENTINNQTVEIYADNQLFTSFDVNVQNDTRVISALHSEPTWGINKSAYAKPVAEKKTKKIMKMADAVDVHIKGETSNKLFIDGISISYRQTGRKKF